MRLSYFAMFILLISVGVGEQSPNAYAEDTLHEKITDISTTRIGPEQEAIISSSADKVLRRIAQARGDLHGEDYAEALDELQEAHELLSIIADGLPTTKVKDHIWVAKKHLQYENTKDVLPDFVPIFSSLDDIGDVVPTQLARKHLSEARKSLKMGNRKEARERLREASAALIYTEEDLPLRYTKEHVNQAVTDIRNKQYKQADKLLKSAEDSVNYLSLDVPSPLTLAKDTLGHAADHYFGGDRPAAKRELKMAVKYLKGAARGSDELSAKMSGNLARDAKALLGNLGKKDPSNKDKLAALLERVRALAERDAESYSTGWDILQGPNPIKPLVIQAQLHIAYAETDAHILEQNTAAKKQLIQAIDLIKRAKEKSGTAFARSLAVVENELTDLKKDAATDSAAKDSQTADEYETARGQLRQLIMEM